MTSRGQSGRRRRCQSRRARAALARAALCALCAATAVRAQTPPRAELSVEVVAPREGEVFRGPARVKLTAEASDADGTLKQVAFYDGAQLLGEGAPAGDLRGWRRTFFWENVPPGVYKVTAVAVDGDGVLSAPSDPLLITVRERQ